MTRLDWESIHKVLVYMIKQRISLWTEDTLIVQRMIIEHVCCYDSGLGGIRVNRPSIEYFLNPKNKINKFGKHEKMGELSFGPL